MILNYFDVQRFVMPYVEDVFLVAPSSVVCAMEPYPHVIMIWSWGRRGVSATVSMTHYNGGGPELRSWDKRGRLRDELELSTWLDEYRRHVLYYGEPNKPNWTYDWFSRIFEVL